MPQPPRNPHLVTPAELKQRIDAERTGQAFLVYRDGAESQRISCLPGGDAELSVGRSREADLSITWDPLVSDLHAMLRRAGGSWLVIDDGLSRNGTFVNGERVLGRTRLRDGDEVKVGKTVLAFRVPSAVVRASTEHASGLHALPHSNAFSSCFAVPTPQAMRLRGRLPTSRSPTSCTSRLLP